MKTNKMFEFIKSKTPNLVNVLSVKSKDYDDEDGLAFEHYIVKCKIRMINPTGSPSWSEDVEKSCLVNVTEYNNWLSKEESIKWI